MKVRIESNDTLPGLGTRVTNAETGEEIRCTLVRWSADMNGARVAELTLAHGEVVEVDVEGELRDDRRHTEYEPETIAWLKGGDA